MDTAAELFPGIFIGLAAAAELIYTIQQLFIISLTCCFAMINGGISLRQHKSPFAPKMMMD
jgi:hypothetical protein